MAYGFSFANWAASGLIWPIPGPCGAGVGRAPPGAAFDALRMARGLAMVTTTLACQHDYGGGAVLCGATTGDESARSGGMGCDASLDQSEPAGPFLCA